MSDRGNEPTEGSLVRAPDPFFGETDDFAVGERAMPDPDPPDPGGSGLVPPGLRGPGRSGLTDLDAIGEDPLDGLDPTSDLDDVAFGLDVNPDDVDLRFDPHWRPSVTDRGWGDPGE
jgi:hypothetical protein